MDFINNKPIFVSSAIGGWYPAGLDRLHRSLIFNGTAADFLFYKNDYPPNSPTHQDDPYAFKIYGFREAIRRGYRVIVHLDCSFWAVKNPDKIFDIVYDNGIFAFKSGYNCAQTCSDALLSYAGMTRDEAEMLPEIATGIVGLNLDNPNGKAVFDLWAEYCDAGLFKNSRHHDINDSADPRFLHGRQDQSCFAIAVHKVGAQFDYQDYVSYYGTGYNPDKLIFFIGGL